MKYFLIFLCLMPSLLLWAQNNPMNLDEQFTYQVIQGPGIDWNWISIDVHPSGYYILLNVWSSVSEDIQWLRLFNIGLLASLLYFLWKKHHSQMILVFIGISWAVVDQVLLIRHYMVYLWAWVLLYHWLEKYVESEDRKYLTYALLLCTFGVFIHYYLIMLLVILVVFLIFHKKQRSLFKKKYLFMIPLIFGNLALMITQSTLINRIGYHNNIKLTIGYLSLLFTRIITGMSLQFVSVNNPQTTLLRTQILLNIGYMLFIAFLIISGFLLIKNGNPLIIFIYGPILILLVGIMLGKMHSLNFHDRYFIQMAYFMPLAVHCLIKDYKQRKKTPSH